MRGQSAGAGPVAAADPDVAIVDERNVGFTDGRLAQQTSVIKVGALGRGGSGGDRRQGGDESREPRHIGLQVVGSYHRNGGSE